MPKLTTKMIAMKSRLVRETDSAEAKMMGPPPMSRVSGTHVSQVAPENRSPMVNQVVAIDDVVADAGNHKGGVDKVLVRGSHSLSRRLRLVAKASRENHPVMNSRNGAEDGADGVRVKTVQVDHRPRRASNAG
jgi:hypothetical protein